MSARRPRAGAPLLCLALALTAAPAAASTSQQPTTATPLASTLQPAEPQAPKQLVLNVGESGPVQPGGEVGLGLFVQNRGDQTESYVLTVTLPPEQTLLSLSGMGAQCRGTVCQGTVAPGADATINLQLRTRLSSSFRGTTTTVRSELQQDANPDAGARTRTTAVPVQQPAGGGAAPASSGTAADGTGTAANTATATGTLPRTGERTTTTALTALGLLVLGGLAQVAGSRRPAAHGG